MTDSPEVPEPAGKGRKRRFSRGDLEAQAHVFEEDFRAQVAATRAQIDATNVKIVERTGRNLPLAILIGLGLGAALLVSLLIVKVFFILVAAVLVGFTSYELASALRFAGRDVPRWPTVIAALAVLPASFFLGDLGHWLFTLGGIVFIALWRLVEVAFPANRISPRDFWKDVGAGSFIQVYVAFLGSFAVLLTARPDGQFWTLAFLIVVVSVDVGAYATGLNFGKHKMAPKISPKKTWEGFAGSAFFALVAGILLSIFMLKEPFWVGIVLAVVMIFTATIGDLTESLIKRDLGIKDISTFLPGHGGFLDRLDSTLPSAAAAYLLYLVFYGVSH